MTVKSALPVVACLWLTCACADDTDRPSASAGTGVEGLPRLAVLGSDFQTSTLSFVDLGIPAVEAAGVLHSGSAVGPGGTALSGDVVLAHSPTPDGRVVLVDRKSGVLTFVDPAARKVVFQVSVATGFYANIQDLAQVSADKGFVSRMGRNPTPTPAPGDFDEGDDLLTLDLAARKVAGRLALASYATLAGTLAAPGRMAIAGGRVWVPLASLSANFKTAGTGRVVAVDAVSGAVVRTIDAPDAKNCVTATATPGSEAIAVVCSGFFGDGAVQAKYARLLWLSPDGPAETVVRGDQVGDRPIQAAAFVDATRAVLLTAGSFDAGIPDRLWWVDRAKATVQPLGQAAGAFALSGLWADVARQRVYVGERDRKVGDVRVFEISTAGAVEAASLRMAAGLPGAVDLAGVP